MFQRQSDKMTKRDLLAAIDHLAEGALFHIQAYHHLHLSGFADWRGGFRAREEQTTAGEQITAVENLITDNDLREAFCALMRHLREMEKVDQEITEWVARFVGLSLRDKRDIARLEKRLDRIITAGPDGRYQGPVWAMSDEYQGFIQKSQEVLALARKARQQVHQRIRQLMEDS